MFDRKSNKPERREAEKDAPPIAETPVPAKAAPAPTVSKPITSEGSSAMIGSKVKINGDVVSGEDLLVEGEVSGTITLTDNELVIGTSGHVEANVSAKTIRIEGEVKGDIDASERVVICASGNVQGNVSAPRVMLEDGGRFKGSIDMGGAKSAAPAAKPAAATTKPEVHSIDKTG